MTYPEAPNHALQRTAPCVTAPASAAAFPPTMLSAARHSAVAELEVVRRFIFSYTMMSLF